VAFLQGMHGTVALVLICSLLFLDEAGIPLPIAPSEGLLLLIGVLVAGGAFPLVIIVPVAFVAMLAGMLAGYGWARTIGQNGLRAIAARVRAEHAYDRARVRLQSAGASGIAVCRVIPGVRPYATLISGAAEVDIRTFLLGAFPALLLWEIVWIAAGMLVGLPVALLLGRFEMLVVRGVILIALGAIIWFSVREVSDDRRAGVALVAPRFRASLALVFDAAVVAAVVAGLFAIARRVIEVSANGWLEILVTAIALMALLIAGRGLQTPGETLFETRYWHHSAAGPS